MNWIEILLIILGIVAFLGSFFINGKSEDENEAVSVDPDIVRDMVNKEMEDARDRVNEVVDETLQYAVEKTERATERISNEKIMAINEYSETVLADINKNHQEVLFLYDMLNDKHNNIKETVKQVDKSTKQAKEAFDELKNVEAIPHVIPAPAPVYYQAPVAPIPAPEPEPIASVIQPVAPVVQPEPVKEPEPEIEPEAPVIEDIVVMPQEAVKLEAAVEQATKPVENVAEPDFDEESSLPENNNDRILEMHRAGVDNVQIAKELGLGVGEVKLVINLFKGAM